MLFASWVLVQLPGCADPKIIDCPAGFELNADGSECVRIRCEGGVISEGRCVCPDGTDLVDGTCTDPECVGLDCDDDNECTADSCTKGVCANDNVGDGTACDGGMGQCMDGGCVPTGTGGTGGDGGDGGDAGGVGGVGGN